MFRPGCPSTFRYRSTARIWTRLPDCSVTTEASQYPAMPYLSPCASSHAASGAEAGLMGGRAAAAASDSSAISPVAAPAAPGRDHSPARHHRGYFAVAAGRWHHGDQVRADVEDDRGEQQLLGPAGPAPGPYHPCHAV